MTGDFNQVIATPSDLHDLGQDALLQLVDQEQHDTDGGVLGDILFIQSATDPLAVVHMIWQIRPTDFPDFLPTSLPEFGADAIQNHRSFQNP